MPVADVPAAGVVPEPVQGVLPPRALRRQHGRRRVGRRSCMQFIHVRVSAHRYRSFAQEALHVDEEKKRLPDAWAQRVAETTRRRTTTSQLLPDPDGPMAALLLPACAIGSDPDRSNGLRNVYLRDRVYGGSTQQRITVRTERLELVVKEIL